MENMDVKMAYQVMLRFLENYFERTQTEDIGALLGSMSLMEDGMPADSAMWQEWLEVCVIVA